MSASASVESSNRQEFHGTNQSAADGLMVALLYVMLEGKLTKASDLARGVIHVFFDLLFLSAIESFVSVHESSEAVLARFCLPYATVFECVNFYVYSAIT